MYCTQYKYFVSPNSRKQNSDSPFLMTWISYDSYCRVRFRQVDIRTESKKNFFRYRRTFHSKMMMISTITQCQDRADFDVLSKSNNTELPIIATKEHYCCSRNGRTASHERRKSYTRRTVLEIIIQYNLFAYCTV